MATFILLNVKTTCVCCTMYIVRSDHIALPKKDAAATLSKDLSVLDDMTKPKPESRAAC